MKLILTRPLAFFDLEATGLNTVNDRIVEIAVTKLFPDGSRESKCRRINPGISIPPAASLIHGITDSDVADCPKFNEVAQSLYEYISNCDIAGFNSNSFDLPMLFFHFSRAGIEWDYQSFAKIDVGNIFKRKEERTLSAGLKFYTGRSLENAHAADADTEATVDIFLAQIDKYDDLPLDLAALEKYSNYDRGFLDLSGKFSENENGDIILNFGKHKGEKAMDHLGFVEWMLRADFPIDTCNICWKIIEEANASFANLTEDDPF